MMASTALTVAAAGHRNGSNEETEHQQLANGSLLASIARFLPAPQKRRDLENILLGVPPGERSEFLRALLCDEVSDPLATGSLLAVELAGSLLLLGRGKLNVSDALEISGLPIRGQTDAVHGTILGERVGELLPDFLLAQVLIKALDKYRRAVVRLNRRACGYRR